MIASKKLPSLSPFRLSRCAENDDLSLSNANHLFDELDVFIKTADKSNRIYFDQGLNLVGLFENPS